MKNLSTTFQLQCLLYLHIVQKQLPFKHFNQILAYTQNPITLARGEYILIMIE